MLAARGFHEDAAALIAQLTGAAGESGLTEGFGTVCHHYFNLRTQGLGREAALDALRRRYGVRS
jgi:hypothetical protein